MSHLRFMLIALCVLAIVVVSRAITFKDSPKVHRENQLSREKRSEVDDVEKLESLLKSLVEKLDDGHDQNTENGIREKLRGLDKKALDQVKRKLAHNEKTKATTKKSLKSNDKRFLSYFNFGDVCGACENHTCYEGDCYNDDGETKGYYCDCWDSNDETEFCDVCKDEKCDRGFCLANKEETRSTTTEPYYCVCWGDYTGQYCETDMKECIVNNCQNGAECVRIGAVDTCECRTGWHGNLCEKQMDQCADKTTCKNGGTCYKYPNETDFECACPEDYEGDLCEKTDLCPASHHVDCQNGGKCKSWWGLQYCECKNHYYGILCEYNDCEYFGWDGGIPYCENNSTCTADPVTGHGTCTCKPGYTGTYCEKRQTTTTTTTTTTVAPTTGSSGSVTGSSVRELKRQPKRDYKYRLMKEMAYRNKHHPRH